MKTLYLECRMGASGDMLMAALSELLPEPESFVQMLNKLQLPGVKIDREYRFSAGIRGAHMRVWVNGQEETCTDASYHEHPHEHAYNHHHAHEHEHHHTHDHKHDLEHGHTHSLEHHHMSMEDVRQIIENLTVSPNVRQNALAVYRLIAEAESTVHGCPVSEIHFHEVGMMDAVADIVGVCMLMELIGAERIICSPIHVGSGMVRCAHGVLPVPAPATATILQGIPCYSGTIEGELCTPTGAALLKHFANSFSPMPVMTTEKIGIGLGSKEFPVANMLRAFVGETEQSSAMVEEIDCNIDDCTGEEIGYTTSLLLKNGALDAFVTPIQMKKSRPGFMLTVISNTEDADRFTDLILRHTSTLGVRRKTCSRTCLKRQVETRETRFGLVRYKVSYGHGIGRTKAEFDDLARIAVEHNLTLREVLESIDEKSNL